MRLRQKEFERRMRRRLRARLAQSPAEWKEYQRYGWWQKMTQTVHLPAGTLRLLILPMVAASLSSGLRNSIILEGAILVWIIVAVIWRAGQLTVALRSSPRLLVLGHLPMSDTGIFDQQWKAYLKSSFGTVLDFALLYLLLGVAAQFGWGSLWIGLVFAVVQWFVVLTLAVLFVTYCWNRKIMGAVIQCLSFRRDSANLRERFIRAGGLLVVVTIIGLVVYGLRGLGGWMVWVPPLGLAHELLGLDRTGSSLAQLWTAFSLAGILLLLPLAHRRLKATYRLPEGLVAGEREQGETEATRRWEISDETEDACAEIKAAIRRREFLREANWREAGWLEGFTARWLTIRERTAAEFLFAGTPAWTWVLRRLLMGGMLCALIWYFVPNILLTGGFIIPFLIFMFTAGKNADFTWPGSRCRTVSGSNMAMHVVYPIGFWRITRIVIKVRLVHLGLLLVMLGLPAACLLLLKDPRINPGVTYYSGRILILALALTSLAPLLQISQGTNDMSKLRMLTLTLPGVGLVIGLTLSLFMVEGAWGYLAGLGLGLASCAGLLLYGRAYNRGWFDAQAKPQVSTSFKLSRSQ